MEQSHHPTTSYQTHILIWLGLLILTALTIASASIHLKHWNSLVAITIAGAKSTLVLLFFMHLRHESRTLKAMFLVTMLVFVVILALTFSDIWFRMA